MPNVVQVVYTYGSHSDDQAECSAVGLACRSKCSIGAQWPRSPLTDAALASTS